ncbi:MAG TPA: choice-of-anchor D domain-containing protein [Terriglobales bacterium]|jgi:N-acetylneuraminic acid mutarotase|nr:choice-of-anchor D domain-containing protein [Terriglobales bacterium]
MKRLSCALFALTFVLVGIQSLLAQVQGQWASTGTMQSARELNAQVVLSNGKVLSIGGVDGSGNLLASSELYNPKSGKWALSGSMSQAREAFPAVVLPNKKVLVSGGLGASSTVLSGAELYDPTTGAWSSAGSLSVARFAHTATLLQNGKVLVTGGCTASICGPETAVSELYDPTSNSWSITGNLNTARGYHTAVRLKTGMVLVIGGFSDLTSCELYDPTTGIWTNAASTNAGRYLNTATVLSDGKVLVAGGANGRYPVSSAELYDPTANTWTYTGNMTIGRYAHTATLLTDGTVLVPGGVGQPISCGKDCTGYIPTSKVDIYSEANGSFKSAPSLSQPQAYQSTTLLKTGGALQDGGIGTTNICCVVLNTAQIYTPLTLTFSASSLNFGLLQIGLTSPPQTVTVTNVSNRSVKFSSIATSGEYSLSHNCPATLSSGQNCTITVTFAPTVAGTKSGAVTLKDNSPGSPTQTIALTGTGEALALGFTPASLNLGSIAVGSSTTLTATLTNDGAAAVNITGTSIAPADGTFTQTNNCPATLNVQQTCTFQVTFTPPDVFTYNGTLSVSNSAGGAATLQLTGTGLDGP